MCKYSNKKCLNKEEQLEYENMKKIDELDKNTPFYNQTDESLDGFAKWNPDFDSQK